MFRFKKFFQDGRDLFTRRQSSIFSAAFIIALTYGISMVLGIFRERLLVATFYALNRGDLDVYYAAFRLPDMIFQLVVLGALSAAFIPVFSEKLEKNEESAYRLASSLINLLMGFFIFLAILIFIFARPFSGLITGNFSPEQITLMAQMTRAMLLAQIFFLLSNFFSAMVQSHQRFLLPALAPVVYNLGIITSILFLSGVFGIWSATIGVLFGALLHFLIQIPLVIKLGFRYFLVFDWQNSGVRKVLKLMFPRTLALAASQIEATVSLFLATSLSPGSLTIYYLAQRLTDLPVRLLGTSIGQAALPQLSLQLARKQEAEFRQTLNRSLSQIFYLALPATAIFLVLRVQLVRFAYGAKSFPWTATLATGQTLAAIAFSIFSQSAVQLLVRGFYALHDTTLPFVISLTSVLFNVCLSLLFIFVFKMGIFGLALAFSLSSFLNFLLLLIGLNRKGEAFLGKKDFLIWLKMGFSSVLAAVFSWSSMKFLDLFVFETSRAIPLLLLTVISVLVGFSVYFFPSWFFNFRELKVLLSLGERLTRWRKDLKPMEEIIEPQGTA